MSAQTFYRAAFTLQLLLVAALVAAAGSGRAGTATLRATAIAAGGEHSCALTSTGGVKCWGIANGSRPVDVSGLGGGLTAIAVGDGHGCALTKGGGVKCWGNNFGGPLGDGTGVNSGAPVDVSGLSGGVAAIAAGGYHTCALTTLGGVKCWGQNRFGRIGDGTNTDRWTPVDVSGLGGGVAAIAAGGYHTCALTTAGGVKCWGLNDGGELGDGTTSDRWAPVDVSGLRTGVTAIAAGSQYSCAVTSTRGVKCWGSNGLGQLGDGTTTDRSTPVDVSGLSSSVTAIALGGEHSCALTSTGGVKCWGANFRGELGDGTRSAVRFTPVDVSGLSGGVAAIAAGGEHTCVLTSSGGVKCWGRNDFGQLGDGRTAFGRRTPVGVVGFGAAEASLAIVSRSVTVTPARIAAVKLRCGFQARCRGRLTLTAFVRGKLIGSSADRVRIRLGRRTFSIAPGGAEAVKVKLTAPGFKVLVRVKRLPTRIAVSYEQHADGTTAATGTITLAAPRVLKQ